MLSFKELMNEVAEPKAGDEQRFKAKHIVQVIDDPHMDKENREGTKKSPSKKKRLADMEKGEDELVYEQHMMTCEDCGEEYDADEGEHECDVEEHFERIAGELLDEGINVDDLTEEQLDEILGRIVRGAGRLAKRAVVNKQGNVRFSTAGRADSAERTAARLEKKKQDRERLKKAQARVAKARQELRNSYVPEEKMTDAEMKKREEIVKGMKDKEAELKKRYGDRWKSVMYATATKKAMEEAVELDEVVKVTVKPKGNSRYFTIIKTTNTKSYPIGDEISDDDISMMQSDGKVKVDIKESTELDEGSKEKALKALMTKALGGKRAKLGYTTSIANNGDFVVHSGSGHIVGRLKKGEFKDPLGEEVELDEAIEVSHARYMRSHGKRASSGTGSWMFTHKRMGDVDHKNEKEVYSAPSGKFSDAKKAAQKWAKKHGHSTIYVMEEVELDEAFKVGILKLKDDSTVKLTNDDAQALNNLYKNLNTSNSTRMIEKLYANKKSFSEILAFAKQAM